MGKDRIKDVFLKMAEKRTTFNLLFFILVLILGRASYLSFFIGLPFIIIGIFIRIVAAGTIKKNVSLTITGPYRICRHPLYLGSFFLSLGLVIIAKNIFISFFFLIFFACTYIPAMLKEERFLIGKFEEDYLNYKKNVPCFIPSMRKINNYNFSWRQLKENKEYINWIIVSVTIAILLIKSHQIF